ncbi:MAG: cell division protein FtsL [Pseudomonadales bacterium]
MKQRLLLVVLACLVALTGVEVVSTAHAVRSSHAALEVVRAEQNEALTRHSQLLLEMGAVASLSHVQEVAQNTLQMRFPDRSEVRTGAQRSP